MSTAVAAFETHDTALSIRDDQQEFTTNQLAALSQLGVANAPRAQSAVFFHQAVRSGLDPFAKQIYMIGRNSKEFDPQTRQERWVTKYTIQTGIDGYRLIARRAADRAGDELRYGETLWCGPDGVWHDVWVYDRNPTAAKVTVFRAGCPFTHVSVWSEYVQNKSGGGPNAMWSRMPSNQLAKTAEAGALRKAFPLDMSGVYTDDEMPDVEPTDMGEQSQEPVTVQVIRTTPETVEQPSEPVEYAQEPVEEPPMDQQEQTDQTPPEPVEPEPVHEPTEQPEDTYVPVEEVVNPSAPEPTDAQPCSLEQRRNVGKILTERYGNDNDQKAQALTDWAKRPISATKELTAVEAAQFISESETAS